MNTVQELVERIEEAGGILRLRGQKITYDLPEEVTPLLDELRANRDAVVEVLRLREVIPAMPPGIHLVSWNLKEPPVAIEYSSVVVDPRKFARATLGELAERIRNPRRKYGWTIPQLIDRLAQVGVTVTIPIPLEQGGEKCP